MSDVSPQSLSEELFGFAVTFDVARVDDELLHWSALRVVDTVGSALAAASDGEGIAASKLIASESRARTSGASVWGSGGVRAASSDAALANGMLSHGIEYDDTHTSATLHPGSVVVPAVLAVAEEYDCSGKEVLAAVLVGYEVAARLGRLRPGRFQTQGFHPSSVLGIFGALAGVARILKLEPDSAVHAAGLAGSMASGLMEYLSDASSTKQLHPGWAAHGAIMAAKLALSGATGPRTVFEGPKGVFASHLPPDAVLVGGLEAASGLGDEWVGRLVATKPYPACHSNHAPVDCWIRIRDREHLGDEDVAKIVRVTGIVPDWYRQLVCDPIEHKRAPRSVYEARFSLPYSVARAIVDGHVDLDSYAPDALTDARVLEVAQKVDYEVYEYPTFPEAFPGGLRVELSDGRVFEEHMPYNEGSVENPLTDGQIQDKLLHCAGRIGAFADVEALLESIMALADDQNAGAVSKAMSALSAPSILSSMAE